MSQDYDISHEAEIVWLEDVSALEYVREAVYFVHGRTHRPAFDAGAGGRLVGYAQLGPDAQGANGYYLRRVWWIQGSDFYRWPTEAVTPSTVAPGVRGRLVKPNAS